MWCVDSSLSSKSLLNVLLRELSGPRSLSCSLLRIWKVRDADHNT